MLRKKLLPVCLAALISFSLVGCAFVEPNQNASTASQSPNQDESTNGGENSETGEDGESSIDKSELEGMDPMHPDNVGTESGELPVIEGDSAFVAAFTSNQIDFDYMDAMNKAGSVADMVKAANDAASAWETQINFSFTQLIDSLGEEDKEKEELEQSAWSNELSIAIDEIKAGVTDDAGSSGSLDVAYKVMLLYRNRAVAIFEKLYEITGTVELHQAEGEAMG